jgi:glucose-6-phosphate isomerase
MFKEDPDRCQYLTFDHPGFYFDLSKNWLTRETIGLLKDLADEVRLDEAKKAMFSGERINGTENRAVLHVALRNLSNRNIYVDDENVMSGFQ